ncbi:keratin, type I cytoskeletal 9-like [Mastomys coucha]|uniref:keratin, type I cytoskeletal 9-like n=1 Tax=Mastomys coucha TaxID=35658 RepID=UPI001261D62B|nr:keratin, type I cytoskeletal 9-like [Mastomys coucha]
METRGSTGQGSGGSAGESGVAGIRVRGTGQLEAGAGPGRVRAAARRKLAAKTSEVGVRRSPGGRGGTSQGASRGRRGGRCPYLGGSALRAPSGGPDVARGGGGGGSSSIRQQPKAESVSGCERAGSGQRGRRAERRWGAARRAARVLRRSRTRPAGEGASLRGRGRGYLHSPEGSFSWGPGPR